MAANSLSLRVRFFEWLAERANYWAVPPISPSVVGGKPRSNDLHQSRELFTFGYVAAAAMMARRSIEFELRRHHLWAKYWNQKPVEKQANTIGELLRGLLEVREIDAAMIERIDRAMVTGNAAAHCRSVRPEDVFGMIEFARELRSTLRARRHDVAHSYKNSAQAKRERKRQRAVRRRCRQQLAAQAFVEGGAA